MGFPVSVRLIRNPWSGIISDGSLLQILQTAAINAWKEIQHLIENGAASEEDNSFAVVLLDPTRPRWARTLADRVYSILLIGENPESFLRYAAGKADAHDRHGFDNGELITAASHCLGNGDCAWGNSDEYKGAVGGGSGLLEEQDKELIHGILVNVVEPVRKLRDKFIEERRRNNGDHGWYNPEDRPDPDYTTLLDLEYTTTTAA